MATIDEGDKVGISIDAESNNWIEGVVRHRPTATGDAWIIENDTRIYYVQTYCYVQKLK